MANTSKLTQSRLLNGDFARAYKYSLSLTAQVAATSLTTIISEVDNNNLNNLLSSSCVQIQIPAGGSQEITVDIGQHTMRLPGRKDTPGSISPEFLISGNYALYKFFRKWANLSSSYLYDSQVAQSKFLADLTIIAYDVEDNVTQRSKLLNVWCRNCPELSFNDATNDVIRLTPELAYELVDDNFYTA